MLRVMAGMLMLSGVGDDSDKMNYKKAEKNATGKYPEIFGYPGTIRIFSHVMRKIVNTRRDPIRFLLMY